MNAPRKPHNLHVVRSPGTGRGRRVVNAEALSAAQHETVQRHLGMHGVPQGVLVGALVGEAAWEVFPMLLINGVVSILRVTDPALGASPDKLLYLRVLYGRLSTASVRGITVCGEGKGAFWALRQFSAATLEDCAIKGELPTSPIELAGKFLPVILQIHRHNCFHGHISLANISIIGEYALLHDHGFYAASAQKIQAPDVAPEILSGGKPTPASDVFGVGVMLQQLLGSSVSAEQQAFLDTMTMSAPEMRPTIQQVWEVFLSSPLPKERAPNVIQQETTGRVASGKVITKQQLAKPPRAEEPLPPQASRQHERHADYAAEPPKKHVSRPPPPRREEPPPRPVQDEDEAEAKRTRAVFYTLVIAAALIMGALYWKRPAEKIETVASSEYHLLWTSGQPSLMQQVVDAALIDGDEAAEMTIIGDALKGNTRPQVHSSIIKTAFNPLWERELSIEDRRLVLNLALPTFIGEGGAELPALENAYPGITLAVLATLPVDKGDDLKFNAPIKRFFKLPSPVGVAFELLASLGVQDARELPARALAHIVVGDVSGAVVSKFFEGGAGVAGDQIRLKLLLVLFSQQPALAETVIETLNASDSALSEWLRWFFQEDFPRWGDESPAKILGLMAGEANLEKLSFEQKVDLLSFPDEALRLRARELIKGALLHKSDRATVDYIAGKTHLLTRLQVIYLILAHQLPEEHSLEKITSWFELKPKPDAASVMQLLLARRAIVDIDEFNIQAARYLMDQKWDLSMEGLKLLGRHSEPLARALAYTKLSAADPHHRELLIDFASREKSPRLKQELDRKIAESEIGP